MFIELYTWNLYNFINQCHPIKFNKKEKKSVQEEDIKTGENVFAPITKVKTYKANINRILKSRYIIIVEGCNSLLSVTDGISKQKHQ